MQEVINKIIGLIDEAAEEVKTLLNPIREKLLAMSNWDEGEIKKRLDEYQNGKRDPLTGELK